MLEQSRLFLKSFVSDLARVINPRRACAARVTVVGLRESWGAMFSTTGGKGKERGGKGKRGRREEGGQSAISGGKFKFCT